MPWGPDVETNLAISSANHLKVRFIQQSHPECNYNNPENHIASFDYFVPIKRTPSTS
ncbi:hypothetical protein [Arsenophonus endosymbiont of Aphis craccivora]|uniref:hypothetical protein n=1 Tax=Arsenophonus endosymbiont of Aphis craccivora TaxID=1231049 RepID=UPI0015DF7C3A|nr:hypothetical protein [Arsenophonus endosymbiont of Aphis craccivora]